MMKAIDNKQYDAIAQNRNNMGKKVYQMGYGIYLEYWNENNYEFTIPAVVIKDENKMMAMNMMLSIYLASIDNEKNKLARLLADSPKLIADFMARNKCQ